MRSGLQGGQFLVMCVIREGENMRSYCTVSIVMYDIRTVRPFLMGYFVAFCIYPYHLPWDVNDWYSLILTMRSSTYTCYTTNKYDDQSSWKWSCVLFKITLHDIHLFSHRDITLYFIFFLLWWESVHKNLCFTSRRTPKQRKHGCDIQFFRQRFRRTAQLFSEKYWLGTLTQNTSIHFPKHILQIRCRVVAIDSKYWHRQFGVRQIWSHYETTVLANLDRVPGIDVSLFFSISLFFVVWLIDCTWEYVVLSDI